MKRWIDRHSEPRSPVWVALAIITFGSPIIHWVFGTPQWTSDAVFFTATVPLAALMLIFGIKYMLH